MNDENTDTNGNKAGERILAGHIDLDSVETWLNWPNRAHGSVVLEHIVGWLLVQVKKFDHCCCCGRDKSPNQLTGICDACYESQIA